MIKKFLIVITALILLPVTTYARGVIKVIQADYQSGGFGGSYTNLTPKLVVQCNRLEECEYIVPGLHYLGSSFSSTLVVTYECVVNDHDAIKRKIIKRHAGESLILSCLREDIPSETNHRITASHVTGYIVPFIPVAAYALYKVIVA